jgi:hypothetical protein
VPRNTRCNINNNVICNHDCCWIVDHISRNRGATNYAPLFSLRFKMRIRYIQKYDTCLLKYSRDLRICRVRSVCGSYKLSVLVLKEIWRSRCWGRTNNERFSSWFTQRLRLY